MRAFLGIDLEDLVTTEAAATVIGQQWLIENLPSPLLPLEVRYLDPSGERQSVEVAPALTA